MMQQTKRIEYIDALRGFTMLLVVFGHIIMYSYHESNESIVTFNQAVISFHMPLFFFVSGYIFHNVCDKWGGVYKTLKIKALSLTIPTIFFLIIYDFIFDFNIVDSLLSITKYGYWFTITLFEYFVIYTIGSFVINRLNNTWIRTAAWAVILTLTLFAAEECNILKYIVPKWLLNLLGFNMLRFFSFFFFGTFVRRHFEQFLKITTNGLTMGFVILTFFLSVIFQRQIDTAMPGGGVLFILIYELRFLLAGILGLTVIFTFFRKYEVSFSHNTRIGRWLQYVGRRTLDVYLLHYFFLPRNLEIIGQFFKNNPNPTIEFFVSLSIAVLVVILCLVMSNVLRLSSFFERYLFGVKPKIASRQS